MRDIQAAVEDQLRAATVAALGPEYADTNPLIRPANPSFGDYQANLALPLAKNLRRKPREVATLISDELSAQIGRGEGCIAEASVAGPGFINVKLSNEGLCRAGTAMFNDERLGIALPSSPDTVVVDYASPNLAKEMHVGHLRSSILGDAIARLLSFAGHKVIRQNHIGDWGTQFGMLLQFLLDSGWDREGDHTVTDLTRLYQQAKARFDSDPNFADRARKRVVTLQAGDEESLVYWRQLIGESCAHMNEIFAKLGILLTDEDIRGESFFNTRLPAVVTDLRQGGILQTSEGAQVAFCDGYSNKEGNPLPLIIQKSDGGYGYATTDMAAARYRIEDLGANRIVYVVGAPQKDHFGMVFSTLRRSGWAPDNISLEHVAFGTILGKDRKAFRTRSGDSVKLSVVLDEAVERAKATLVEKGRDFTDEELTVISTAVGTGAVKYADLSSDRIKDYTFDYDRMLSMEGNTAPYLQYAYVRIQSILRKVGDVSVTGDSLLISDEAERALLLELLKLPRIIEQVASSLEPHRLCTYLYDIAVRVHRFHEHCPVLRASDEKTQLSRVALSQVAGRTLRVGLSLLGVTVVERM